MTTNETVYVLVRRFSFPLAASSNEYCLRLAFTRPQSSKLTGRATEKHKFNVTVTSLDLTTNEVSLDPQTTFPYGLQLSADIGCFELYLDPALNGTPVTDRFLSTQWSPVGAGELGR